MRKFFSPNESSKKGVVDGFLAVSNPCATLFPVKSTLIKCSYGKPFNQVTDHGRPR